MFNILNHIPSSIKKLHHSLIVKNAIGCWVFCNNGNKYLDLTSGIGALSTGHSHPYLIDKIQEQIEKYVHIPQQVYGSHMSQIELTPKLIDIMPDSSLDNIFYVNSGSEATDNALKIARRYTGKKNIITMNKGFHGRSLGALSITSSNLTCKLDTQPLLPGVFFCNNDTQTSLDLILNHQSSPEETCCIILEPILGEGGIYSMDKEFMKYVREICTQHNILLIADEVQCGSGRTGTWWDIEQKEVIPDMITFGKGIASGFPLAGVASNHKIMNVGKNFLGGTYGGNAICSVAASATIDIMKKENLLQNVTEMGEYFSQQIQQIQNLYQIKEIRQYGLMIAIELKEKRRVMNIVHRLRDEGVLVLTAGNSGQYIRLLPPLNISKKELNIFFEKFDIVLRE